MELTHLELLEASDRKYRSYIIPLQYILVRRWEFLELLALTNKRDISLVFKVVLLKNQKQ